MLRKEVKWWSTCALDSSKPQTQWSCSQQAPLGSPSPHPPRGFLLSRPVAYVTSSPRLTFIWTPLWFPIIAHYTKAQLCQWERSRAKARDVLTWLVPGLAPLDKDGCTSWSLEEEKVLLSEGGWLIRSTNFYMDHIQCSASYRMSQGIILGGFSFIEKCFGPLNPTKFLWILLFS